jgi:hypothetical protein
MIENLQDMEWDLGLATGSRDENWQKIVQGHDALVKEMEADKD